MVFAKERVSDPSLVTPMRVEALLAPHARDETGHGISRRAASIASNITCNLRDSRGIRG
jgi:hypothetical protein